MKAEEWKTFTLVYSLFCLKSVLSKEQFDHWNLYVNACRIFCKRVITEEEIQSAHSLFVNFCKGIEDIYGKDTCTPNTHLHLHLKQCMIDFAPVFSFWCFSFERFNGFLGNYQTNKKDIVVTTMRKICKEAKVNSLDHNDYNSFMPSTKSVKCVSKDLLLKRNKPISLNDNVFSAHLEPTSLPSKVTMTEEKIESLTLLCKTLYHPCKVQLVGRIATLFKRFRFINETYASSQYRKGQNNSKFILAHYLFREDVSVDTRPGIVQGLYEVNLVFEDNRNVKAFFVECKWLLKHPCQYEFGENCMLEVWSTGYENWNNISPFIPLHFLKGKFVSIETSMKFKPRTGRPFQLTDNVNLIIPLVSKSY